MTMPIAANRRWDYAAILLSMLVMTAYFLLNGNVGYSGLNFVDPDDALRLVEVRDWMAGQSWFDVSQHRINPPWGGEMHWWRMLDVPIAAMILFFRLFMSPAAAEHAALIAWPLMLYGLFLLLLRRVLRQLGRDWLCRIGLLMPVSMIFVIRQFQPLRIDHHGWQVIAATALLSLALGERTGRKGVIAGLVMAFYLSISLEALPYFLLFGGLLAWGYWRDADGWPMLRGFLLSCTAGVLMSLPTSRGWDALFATHCDGLSAPYWSALVVASSALLIAGGWLGHIQPARRLALLCLAGLAAITAFLLVAPQCSSGPFSALDPLVERYWYRNVLEGQPLYAQALDTALYSLIPTLVGLAGTVLAIRESGNREHWRTMILLQLGAAAVSIWVMRGMYVSHAFAVPGCAFLVLTIWRRARRIGPMVPRVLASVAAVLAVPAIPLAVVSKLDGAFTSNGSGTETQEAQISPCFRQDGLARLNQLPPSLLFAPIDLGPGILTDTRHGVIATGHHRNQQAMRRVIAAYLADEATARKLILSSRADFLLLCPATEEMNVYTTVEPNGLAGRLLRGDVPAWLAPARRGPDNPYLLYKIRGAETPSAETSVRN